VTNARRLLSKRIRELQGCQQVYIPGVASLLDTSQEDERLEDQPEVLKLWLPSQLSDNDRSMWCLPGIPLLEFHFQYAQASDALAELRRLHQLLQGTRDQNAKHTKSTTSTSRSQGILDGFHGRVKRIANRYREARRALFTLDPNEKLAGRWKHYFLELKDADIRGPDREAKDTSEGRFQQSWIWVVSRPLPNSPDPASSDPQPSVAGPTFLHQQPVPSTLVVSSGGPDSPAVEQNKLDQSHRAHWARAQARAERYEEEVNLTVEEMGRTLKYFGWKRLWWQSIACDRSQIQRPSPSRCPRWALCIRPPTILHLRQTYHSICQPLAQFPFGPLSWFILALRLPPSAHPVPLVRPRAVIRKRILDLSTLVDALEGLWCRHRKPPVPLPKAMQLPRSPQSSQKPLSQLLMTLLMILWAAGQATKVVTMSSCRTTSGMRTQVTMINV
jgi:hypothetical protein